MSLSHTLEHFIGAAERAALAAPIEQARGLPGRAYGADFHRLEQADLFPRTWAAVAFGTSIPNPGDALPVLLAGQPLVAVRQADASIQVFHNVCRHRAMQVVTTPVKGAKQLSCPWHGWSYGIDGSLRATPRIAGEREHQCAAFDKNALGLVPVRTAHWLDYVLVNLDGNAPPFEQHIEPPPRLLEGIDLGAVRHAAEWVGSYPGNWKIAIEGALEDYHLPLAHRQLFVGIESRPVRIDVADAGFAAISCRSQRSEAALPAADIERVQLLRMQGDQSGRGHVVNLFPSAVMLLGATGLFLGTFLPDGPDRTRLEFHLYVAPGASESAFTSAELDALRARMMDELVTVIGQDHDFVARVHQAAAARDAAGIKTRFSPYWEGAVLHFQRMVLSTLSARGVARR